MISNHIKLEKTYCYGLVAGFLFLLLTWPFQISAGTGTREEIKDISHVLEKEIKAQDLPAAAAIVLKDERIAYQGASGVRKLNRPERATIDDRWHLGSCTKAITATMIGRLVEQNKLSWNTTIAGALPGLAKTMRPEYRSVTIEMLLAHRGGIGHEWDVPGLWDTLWKRQGTPVEERRKMATAMLTQPPKVKPGNYFYSNCGYAIAGHMAETITGRSYEQLINQLIFKPLGMSSAGFGVPWEGLPPVEPWPHQHDKTPVSPGKFADNPPSIAPGGTIHASMQDWAKFINEHLKGSQGKDTDLLKASTYFRLHKGQRIDNSRQQYALGWMVLQRSWARGNRRGDFGRCLHHAGSNNSWFALVWIAPEINYAVMVTTNIGGKGIFKKIDAVLWKVIQYTNPIPPD